tara:strand:- start:332 stop:1522 length:1191 start_codon:yes stop_codon:yes gene_type:complete
MKIWTEKYSPKSLREVVGDRPPLLKLQDFILNYSKHKKKSMLVYGPPGTGKSSSVYAIAKENNLDVMELNSSDFRNKKKIEELLGDSVNQASLISSGRVILIDDIDGISGTKDRGAAQALAAILEKSSFPIVLTSNNPWDSKFSTLRNKSFLIEFKHLSYIEIFSFLKIICEQEEISFDEKALKRIAVENEGDLRSAINDLQAVCSDTNKINEESLNFLGYRERKESIFNLLQLIFRSKDIVSINTYIDSVDLNLDEIFLWIEENIPKEYNNSEINLSFENLSKSDVFRGRIRRQQHWRFLIYQKLLMGAGVAFSKEPGKKGFVKYSNPQRILKIWKNKMKYSKKKNISEKLTRHCHLSSRKAMKHIIPYLKNISTNKKFIEELGIDEQDLIGLTY